VLVAVGGCELPTGPVPNPKRRKTASQKVKEPHPARCSSLNDETYFIDQTRGTTHEPDIDMTNDTPRSIQKCQSGPVVGAS
jgi:hypothetical protein